MYYDIGLVVEYDNLSRDAWGQHLNDFAIFNEHCMDKATKVVKYYLHELLHNITRTIASRQ